VLALASPASLKGVLSPFEAAAALATGLRRGGAVEARELPVADGGEFTAEIVQRALGGGWHAATVSDPLGRPVEARWLLIEDGTAVVEAASALGLPLVAPADRDPLHASSYGLGELIAAALDAAPSSLVVCVGGTATVDGGVGLRRALDGGLRGVATRVACDVRNPLLGPRGAAQAFGPQKGADSATVGELERRLASMSELAPYAELPGSGAGGGLGAAFAALGAELVSGSELVLDLIGFDDAAHGAGLVVTGEGKVDATTFEGKAPGAVLERCRRLGIRCVLFGGIVEPGCSAHVLSGSPDRAEADLVDLGESLAAGPRT
jgi:glycerate 2-kinase